MASGSSFDAWTKRYVVGPAPSNWVGAAIKTTGGETAPNPVLLLMSELGKPVIAPPRGQGSRKANCGDSG